MACYAFDLAAIGVVQAAGKTRNGRIFGGYKCRCSSQAIPGEYASAIDGCVSKLLDGDGVIADFTGQCHFGLDGYIIFVVQNVGV